MLPAEGEPKLVIRFVEAETCAEISWIENPILQYDGENPLEATARAIHSLGLGDGRIGIQHDSWFLTLERHAALREALPEATFVGESDIVDRLRAVKSPRELDVLRDAGRIADAGMQAAIDAVEMGVSEREIAAEIAVGMICAGGDAPIGAVFCSGPRTVQMHGAWADRKVERGDLFYFELSGIRHNHWTRNLRTDVVGEPTDEQRRIADAMIAAQDAAIALLRPGTPARADNRRRVPTEGNLRQSHRLRHRAQLPPFLSGDEVRYHAALGLRHRGRHGVPHNPQRQGHRRLRHPHRDRGRARVHHPAAKEALRHTDEPMNWLVV